MAESRIYTDDKIEQLLVVISPKKAKRPELLAWNP